MHISFSPSVFLNDGASGDIPARRQLGIRFFVTVTTIRLLLKHFRLMLNLSLLPDTVGLAFVNN